MRDPIALIGMACRTPGAANTAGLWELMMAGGNPVARLGTDWWTGTIDSVDMFDAGFFGIPPRVAKAMDPQHRMLLEVAHDAISDAGLTVGSLEGTATGVFVAQHRCDYSLLQHEYRCSNDIRAVAGAATGMSSGRLSLAFDLTGPCLTVDTCCSSSLVAVHLAVQSLRSGECRQAIVGAVNLVLLPELNDAFISAAMVATDGRCKFGDVRADGFVRSDGIAAVVLKPLGQAVADGDHVRAIIRGSTLNNDGGSGDRGLFSPSAKAQTAMLHAAYADAGVDPSGVGYVEAHGTGTVAGDAAELTALSTVVGAQRGGVDPCMIGSAKSSIGHAESAAGLIGLIRATMCLERSIVPPNPHLVEQHHLLQRDEAGIAMSYEAAALPDHGRPVLAGVSSFGASGTNGHVVLEAAARSAAVPPRPDDRPPSAVLLVASARTAAALDELADTHRHLVADLPDGGTLDDLAVAMASRRDQHEYRLAVVASTTDEATTLLNDARAGLLSRKVRRGGPVGQRPRTTFVFSGHGSGWVGMGRELFRSDRVFAEAFARCDSAVASVAGWSPLDHLHDDDVESRRRTGVAQPLLWAMQVALAAVWRSWGVEPDAVIGHSQGEVAAANVSGALSLTDGAAVVCHRSRLAGEQRGGGTMLHTEASAAEAARLVRTHGDRVVVAACNGPASTVLSGRHDDLRVVADELDRADIAVRWIDIEIAGHSPQMAGPATALRAALAGLRPLRGELPMYSSVVGGVVGGSSMDGEYWVGNLCRPVRFTEAMAAALATATDHALIEVAPHPVLLPAIMDIAASHPGEVTVLGSLRRDKPEREEMLGSLGSLFVAGVRVEGRAVAEESTGRHVDLPAYPWQRTSYWLDAPAPTPADLRPVHGRESVVDEATRLLERCDEEMPLDPAVPDVATVERTLEEKVAGRVAEMLGLPADEISLNIPLAQLGMDSMLTAELRDCVRRDTGVTLSGPALAGARSVLEVVELTRAQLVRNRSDQAPAGGTTLDAQFSV